MKNDCVAVRSARDAQHVVPFPPPDLYLVLLHGRGLTAMGIAFDSNRSIDVDVGVVGIIGVSAISMTLTVMCGSSAN